MTPAQWKRFYRDERERLGLDAMREMIERAPRVPLDEKRALIFPHMRLEITGAQVGAVAKAIVASRADEVVAIAVLHGAQSGEASIENEFSLDAFEAMLTIAAEMAGREAPRVKKIFPKAPDEDLGRVDCPIVATADPIHHGIGYETAERDALDADRADAFVRESIDVQMRALASHDFDAFTTECARVRSDFRNSGPVLARAMGRDFSFEVIDAARVDYASTLGAPPPTWVAGALISLARH